jgi:hypothetical protein
MTSERTLVPLQVADVSEFTKKLRASLAAVEGVPSHLAFLNIVARAAGFRNFQALRATPSRSVSHAPALEPQPPVPRPVARALSHLDEAGRITRFPVQLAIRKLVLFGLACRFPHRRDMTEREVNDVIARFHTFEDIATLRRELINEKHLWRTRDGRVYRRLDGKDAPPQSDEVKLFLEALRAGRR